jgi:hypothetical protein
LSLFYDENVFQGSIIVKLVWKIAISQKIKLRKLRRIFLKERNCEKP